MRSKQLAFAIFLLSLGLPAVAFAQQSNTPTASAPADDPDQIICKSTPPPTGTRLGGGRECHTKREWDQRQKDSESEVVRGQEIGHMGSGPGH